MAIERIRVGRYRSLYDVEFRPRGFTVLVGPNNSGKTNLVEAVEFLADAYRYGLETAVTRKGGIENIAFRRMRRTKSPVSFEVTAELPSRSTPTIFLRRHSTRTPPDVRYRMTHSFTIAALSQAIGSPFRVAQESVEISILRKRSTTRLLRVDRAKDGTLSVEVAKRPPAWARDVLFPFDDASFLERTQSVLQPTALLVGATAINSILMAFARDLGSARLYQLSPIEARRSGVPTPNPELERHGGNLPAFVNQIRKRGKDEWRALVEAMREVIPGLDDIQTTFTTDRRLSLEFKERGVGRPWTAEEVSDGTIQSLALFAVLGRPTTGLALIEEPETSVHPWIVRHFVDLCRAAANVQQIVLTTHSPALIACLDPREITLVWRSDGRTNVRPLVDADMDVLTMWQQGDLSTFDILDTGIVREAVPGEAP